MLNLMKNKKLLLDKNLIKAGFVLPRFWEIECNDFWGENYVRVGPYEISFIFLLNSIPRIVLAKISLKKITLQLHFN